MSYDKNLYIITITCSSETDLEYLTGRKSPTNPCFKPILKEYSHQGRKLITPFPRGENPDGLIVVNLGT